MSAEEVRSLEEITGKVSPKPVAAKKAAPTKRSPSNASVLSSADTEADIRAELELKLREQIRAELEAELKEEQAERLAEEAAVVESILPEETGYKHTPVGEGEILIHFIDDGATIGNKVYYRGEELAINPVENPWVNYSGAMQKKKFGKYLFARGPWPYSGFDLTDESLTPEDKLNLLRTTS